MSQNSRLEALQNYLNCLFTSQIVPEATSGNKISTTKKLPEEGSQTPPHLQLKKSVYILDVAREPILAPDGQ